MCLKQFSAESALFRRQGKKLLVVAFNTHLFCQLLSDMSASASAFSANGNN